VTGIKCVHDVQHLTEGLILFRLAFVDDCGVTHVVSGDGNVDDRSLQFVGREIMDTGGTWLERELIELLATLPLAERERIWEKHAYSWAEG
jgi:hypothetical protein